MWEDGPDPLDWKLPPRRGEPASGYASRLAALNGETFRSLMHCTGVSAQGVHSGLERHVRDVASLGGLDVHQTEALVASTPLRQFKNKRHAQLRGERLGHGTILSGYFRFCPHCVAQDLVESEQDVRPHARPWLRLEWLIAPVRTCALHSVFLAESDRTSERDLMIDFSEVMATEVLPRLDRLRAEAVPSARNAFEDWVRRRLDGLRDPTNWLDAMPLNAAIFACERLGVEGVADARKQASKLSNADWAKASLAGYRIASRGEVAIEPFLDGLIANSHAAGFVGTKNTYGYMLLFMERSMDDPGFEPFRSIVRRHALENVPLAAGSQVLGEVLKERRLHTGTSAAAASDTSYHTLRAIFARNGIAPAPGGPDHHRLTIRVDEWEARLAEFATALTVSEMRAAIGIPHRHLLELIAEGLVPTVFNSREVNMARHRIARAEVDAFIDRLFEGAVTVDAPTDRQLTLGRACLSASTNIPELVGLILNDRLAWKGHRRGCRRYVDLLVDADEVMRVLQGSAPPVLNHPLKDVRKIVPGLHWMNVKALINAGHLTVVTEFCPTARRKIELVTHESLEAFQRRYVTLSEVCRSNNLNHKTAKKRLDMAGFKPALAQNVVGAVIYERTGPFDDILKD